MPEASQFPDVVLQSITRHGVVPARGYVPLGHDDALITHYPPDPRRPFVVHWTSSGREPEQSTGGFRPSRRACA